jgi:sugar phosphate isomerase/epimerase
MNTLPRRKFLALAAGAIPAVLAAQTTPGAAPTPPASAPAPTPAPAAGGRRGGAANASTAAAESSLNNAVNALAKKLPFGLEMYSVRNGLSQDLPGTVTAVAKQGYEIMEFYAPYYDWSYAYAKNVRTLLEDLGTRSLSTHNHISWFMTDSALAKVIELNQILGNRFVVLATAQPDGGRAPQTVDDWKRTADIISKTAATLKPHGLTPGFHNHDTEWADLGGGQRAMDILAANTPKEVLLQLDVGTCVKAGSDPVAWINANPGRIRSLHLKDWAPGTVAQEKQTRVLFGEGVVPWKAVLTAAETVGGVEYYLMEQEGSRYPELETTQRCFDAWKKLRAEMAAAAPATPA